MKGSVKTWLESLRVPGKPDEWESKNLLRLAGFRVPGGRRILPGEAAEPADFGFPLVLKVCDPEILHKTERGGVLLNVIAGGFSGAVQDLRERFPGSPLLAESLCRSLGTEFILGGLVDPVFGPAVMAGAGGILTEVYEDAVFRLCPCSPDEALRMLGELRIAPVLQGYRGSRLDLKALADTVARLSRLFEAFEGSLSQVDINPLVFTEEGWTALDCVLVIREEAL